MPRKRKKFGNFVKNTLHVRDDAIIDEAFEVVMKVFKDDGAKEDAKRKIFQKQPLSRMINQLPLKKLLLPHRARSHLPKGHGSARALKY